jgi:uncharacterized protein YfdQ (DUF2303 family)
MNDESVASGIADCGTAAVVRDLARESVKKEILYVGGGSVPFMVLQEGYNVHDLSKFLDKPLRTKRDVTVLDAESFKRYFDMFNCESTIVFAGEERKKITAIFDYPTALQPAFSEHSLTLGLASSPEWDAWSGASGKMMTQTVFAEFVERHIKDIVEPDGATMLEISRGIEATKTAEFKSGVRLDNGQIQLTYNENIQGSVQKNNMPIPSAFVIGIAPFKGGDHYKIVVNFRYRINSGNLSLIFELLNPEKILEDAFKVELEKVETAIGKKAILQ